MTTWLITGVSGGIGAALAEAALRAGERVAGTVRREEDGAELAKRYPSQFFPFVADVTNTDASNRAVSDAFAALGEIDVAVLNAGRSLYGAVEETSLEEARRLFDTNVFGALTVARAVLPNMRKRGVGRIVAMSSGCGLSAVPGLGLYSASKFALEGLMEALAAEVAEFGVRVMLVEPGAVATRFIASGTEDVSQKLAVYQRFSSGKGVLEAYYARAAQPADVAAQIRAAILSDAPPLRLVTDDGVAAGARARAQNWLAELERRG